MSALSGYIRLLINKANAENQVGCVQSVRIYFCIVGSVWSIYCQIEEVFIGYGFKRIREHKICGSVKSDCDLKSLLNYINHLS